MIQGVLRMLALTITNRYKYQTSIENFNFLKNNIQKFFVDWITQGLLKKFARKGFIVIKPNVCRKFLLSQNESIGIFY